MTKKGTDTEQLRSQQIYAAT